MGTKLTKEEALASLAAYREKHPGQTHIRKGYAALGDDTTLSRFVKTGEPKTEPRKARGGQLWLPDLRHKALEEGRSLFKTVAIEGRKALLVSGHCNPKIGRDVRKGRFQGYWIYTLTLEERATCPRSCAHWQDCYGNNMPYAKRSPQGPELLSKLREELPSLLAQREGILVRLHALGDFYSVEYVRFWADMLIEHPKLAIYGYTARKWTDPIGAAIHATALTFGERFAMRWSDGGRDRMCTNSILTEADCPPTAFLCPEQTGKTKCCATCGACWTGDKNVAFTSH